jgi:G3E family GTPase
MIGLLTGASALALLSGAAEAASLPVGGVDSVGPARSFAELLDPIPNAAGILRAESERTQDEGSTERPLVLAQYYHHHHHHHHHYHHHHHHHHHWWRHHWHHHYY